MITKEKLAYRKLFLRDHENATSERADRPAGVILGWLLVPEGSEGHRRCDAASFGAHSGAGVTR
jgi:hypothetical protein